MCLRRSFVFGALLLVSLGASALQSFSKKVGPCDNFYKFVCDIEKNEPDDLFVNALKRRLFEEAHSYLVQFGDKDFVMTEIVKQIMEETEIAFYKKEGLELGMEVAKTPYSSVPYIHDNYRTHTVEVQYPTSSNTTTTRCNYKKCHPFYQSLVRGYLSVVDIFQSMDEGQLEIIIHASDSNLPELTEKESWKRETYESLLKNDLFHSHTNMELLDDLMHMYRNVAAEMEHSLRNSSKLDEEQKKDLLRTLASITPHFGLPELFTKKALLNDYFTIAEFTVGLEVVRPSYQQMSARDRISVLVEKLQLVARRFRARHPEIVDDYGWTKTDPKDLSHSSALQFGSSVWYEKSSVFFYPSLIEAVRLKVPQGFKYGFVGTVIANDLFVLLEDAYNKQQAERKFAEVFEQTDSVITDRNMSVQQPAPLPKCPKLFTDADVARVVYRVLEKARHNLDSFSLRSERQKRFAVTTYNDREWFFIGFASRFCTSKYKPSRLQPGFTERSTSREMKNAEERTIGVVRELAQFSKLFQCPAHFTSTSTCGFVPDGERKSSNPEPVDVDGSGVEA
ncbi:hypothetical protein QR680_008681 [Steinernema hermaphroditum]|uniref:Peptidase M13 N-terminal domain-containing protein n=1 Tax=Steinernema hermaphroditum TaxID=289476 RepID=A0AA39M841_9BILA|nr:hypothetical protein QR680_008681 [Steinernema hermaphroditum]